MRAILDEDVIRILLEYVNDSSYPVEVYRVIDDIIDSIEKLPEVVCGVEHVRRTLIRKIVDEIESWSPNHFDMSDVLQIDKSEAINIVKRCGSNG